MIPLKLELTNFLSYRETATLDFNGIHLACISGLNGSGKSSLLDAMTWALFGKSRSKSDDDLVNRIAARNDEQAEVRLVFNLEGAVYRIIRQKRQQRTTVLEFQMALDAENHEAEAWRTMSEGGVRDTQAAIEKLLRMNFDTFTNASFFLQGQADEFTTRTPGQRKEILADLLSVNLWDRYKEAAKKRRDQEETRLVVLDGRVKDIEAELEEQEERQAKLEAAQAELATVAERRQAQEQLLEQMRRVEAAVKQQQQQVNRLDEMLRRAEANLTRLGQTRAQRQEEREAHQALLDEAAAITAAHEAWEEAEETVQAWQEKADAYNRLQQERRPHELALERARSRLTQRRTELEARQERVATMREERERVAQTLAAGKEELAALQAQLADLAEQEAAWHEAQAELQRLEGERKLLAQELKQLQTQAKRIAALRQERAAVAQNLAEAEAALVEVAAQVAALGEKRERHARALAELDNRRTEQPRLREAMETLKERLDTLSEETGGECPLCGQDLSEEHRRQVLVDLEAEGQEKGTRFRENKAKIEALQAEVAQLERDLKDAKRIEREQQAQQQRQATAKARLDEIDRAVAEWEGPARAEGGGPGRVEELQSQLADPSELEAQRSQVKTLEAAVKEKTRLDQARREQEKAISNAEARLAEIDRAVQAWEEEGSAELATVTEQLAAGKVAPEAQTALAELDEQLAAVGYDESAHTAARQARDQLADAPGRYQKLQQARAAVKPLDDTLADMDEQIEEQEANVADLRRQHQEATTQLQALTADAGDVRATEEAVTDLREQENAAHRRVAVAKQRLDVLDELRKQREKLKAERAERTQLIQRLKLLEKACGRDGVQALLIERALPEIEEDANDLLQRLTGGEMRLSFETERQLKSRDATAETLDIRIVDGVGERPYENFSGGEQFRVNFAIRLALSKILAKRAGARLQTLVIDEGFGSQDPAGRQRLVEAINVIKGDFERILVITHIDELKNHFPTRIEVEKDPAGSQITIQ